MKIGSLASSFHGYRKPRAGFHRPEIRLFPVFSVNFYRGFGEDDEESGSGRKIRFQVTEHLDVKTL